MASIHHATIKRAASKGLTMEQTSKNLIVRGDFGGRVGNAEFRFPLTLSAREALDACILAQEISDRLSLSQESGRSSAFKATNGKGIVVKGDDLQVVIEDALHKLDSISTKPAAKAPAPAKAKDADEGDDEGEGEEGGSVVPPKYRQFYQERGDATHCGDDLAKALKALLVNDNGTDEAALRRLAEVNGIDFEKYAHSQTRGWLGRARMSIGNILRGRQRRVEKIVLDLG